MVQLGSNNMIDPNVENSPCKSITHVKDLRALFLEGQISMS